MTRKVVVKKLRDGRTRLSVPDMPLGRELSGWKVDVTYVGPNLVELRLWHEDGDDAPPITATGVLRRVSPEALRRMVYASLLRERFQADRDDNFDRTALDAAEAGWEARKRGRGRQQTWTPRKLAEFVERYSELLDVSTPDPKAVLTKEWGLDDRPNAARGAIQLATAQGLWEPAGKGHRGGRLTPKAKDILRKGQK